MPKILSKKCRKRSTAKAVESDIDKRRTNINGEYLGKYTISWK